MKSVHGYLLLASLSFVALAAEIDSAAAFDVVLSSQGEYLDAYRTDDVDLNGNPRRHVLIAPNDPNHGGRHINGQVCFFPNGHGHDGQFVASDDTYDEVCGATDTKDPLAANYNPRCDPNQTIYVGNNPPGWVVMNPNGTWSGEVIHAAGCGPNGQGAPCDVSGISVTNPSSLMDAAGPMATQGTIDPQGCFFDNAGNLWGTDVGHDGDPTDHDGSLIVFFADSGIGKPPYSQYCFVDRVLFSPAMPYYDSASEAIYLAESGADHVLKYTGPFPASGADCAVLPDHTATVPPLRTVFTTFPADLTLTPAQIVRKLQSDHFYLASVLLLGSVIELDANGVFTGFAAGPYLPNLSLGGAAILDQGVNPDGLDVGSDGTIYISDLNLQTDPATLRFFSTGCGNLRRIKNGVTTTISSLLRFPDGVTVLRGCTEVACPIDLSALEPATANAGECTAESH